MYVDGNIYQKIIDIVFTVTHTDTVTGEEGTAPGCTHRHRVLYTQTPLQVRRGLPQVVHTDTVTGEEGTAPGCTHRHGYRRGGDCPRLYT